MNALATAVRQTAPLPEEGLVGAFNDLREELVGTLYYVLGNHTDAQDAAQAAFLNLWQARASLGEVRDLRAWVFRAALNAAKDLARSAWRRKRRPFEEALNESMSDEPSPMDHLLDRERWDRLRAAVEELRPEERDVFQLRENRDLSYDDIATLRGLPVGTVKTRMRTALQKLRHRFRNGNG